MKRGWDESGLSLNTRTVVILVVVYLLILGGIYVVGSLIEEKPEEYNVYGDLDERFAPTVTLEQNGRTYGHYDNQFTNILFIGVDREQLATGNSYRGGGQADFLLLLAISRDHRTITPIHIDRDTIAEVDIYGVFGDPAGSREMQICLAHAFGTNEDAASENTVRAVDRLFANIPIDYYLTMDMSGIAALNDALGGITVTLEEDFSHLDPEMVQGATIRLEGRQAEYYVRGRYGVGDYSNKQRMTHQQNYIEKALPRLYELMEEDPTYLSSLFNDLSPHISTNLKQSWLLDNSYAIENYDVQEIVSLEGEHGVGVTGFMEFHPDPDLLTDMLIDIFCVLED